MRKNRGRERKVGYSNGSIIVKLSFLDVNRMDGVPEQIDKIVCKTSEKDKGMFMIQRIMARFDIGKKEFEDFAYQNMLKEVELFTGGSSLQSPREKEIERRKRLADKFREDINRPIKLGK